MNQKSFKHLMPGVAVVFAVLILVIAPLLGMAIGPLLLLFAGIFWILMLVDCLQRKENDFPINGQHEKLIWAITLIFLNILGAVLYFALVLMNSQNKTGMAESLYQN